VKISIQELNTLSKKAISKYGYSEEESKIILDMLMYAQMRGNDQGIVKLIGEGIPKNKNAQTPTIEKETPTTAIINANLSMEAIPELLVTGHERSRTQGWLALRCQVIRLRWCLPLALTNPCFARIQ